MPAKLTFDEKKLVLHAKKAIAAYNTMRHKKGGVDTLYSFALSESGKIYDGACFESELGSAVICGERHAIANLVMHESYGAKIRAIVVADPVPKVQKNSTFPCGNCRHVIWSHGTPKTSVILMQYILGKKGWTFPTLEKYTIQKLYPHAYKPADPSVWDNFIPR